MKWIGLNNDYYLRILGSTILCPSSSRLNYFPASASKSLLASHSVASCASSDLTTGAFLCTLRGIIRAFFITGW
jgi:hypothetical protein